MRRWIARTLLTALALTLTTTMTLLPAAPPASAAAPALSDLEGHWSRAQVEAGVAAGYISGYPDGTFRPDADVTRAEFFKLLGAAMRLTPDPDLPTGFREQAAGHWSFAHGHIPAAVSAGLLHPPDYGTAFGPDVPITRREIVLATVRALGRAVDAQRGGYTLSAADAAAYEPWLQQYAAVAMEAGIMKGFPDGSIGLERRATRAEAVVMVQRVLGHITAQVVEEPGAVLPHMSRHPAEGEPTWSHAGTTVTVTDGATTRRYTLPEGAEGVRLLPAPGAAAWVVYALGGEGVVARLAGGEMAELERQPGGAPTPLAADDAGQLWATDTAGRMQVIDPAGQVWRNDAAPLALELGAIDWYGRFWGVSGGRLYRIDPGGAVTRYETDLSGYGPVIHLAVGEAGAVWVVAAEGSDDRSDGARRPASGLLGTLEPLIAGAIRPREAHRAWALQLQEGRILREVPLLSQHYGGLGVEVIGRSGPVLWLTGRTEAGQDGLYRLDTADGAFTRVVLPRTIPDGAAAMPGLGGGVVVTGEPGRFWRVLP